ncbi:MAG: asparaginase [Psychromonas sp.]
MNYDLFVEVTRNNMLESQHFGAAVVCDYKGNIIEQWGNIEQTIFPRSAIKPLLSINLIKSGADESFKLSDKEISLSCGSHMGESIHQKSLTNWLNRLGMNEEHLACGVDLPENKVRAHHLLSLGEKKCKIHHNCSGKHTGFLTTALHLGLPLENYQHIDHPLQTSALKILSEMAQISLPKQTIGIDGCGFPAPTMPLLNLAKAMAAFANPILLRDDLSKAIKRIQRAIINEPFYLSGTNTIVSDLNQKTKGRIIAKTGAEGVMVASIPDKGLGIALKIADGNSRASSVALLEILRHLNLLNKNEIQDLQPYFTPDLINSRGEIVGNIRAASSWLQN